MISEREDKVLNNDNEIILFLNKNLSDINEKQMDINDR